MSAQPIAGVARAPVAPAVAAPPTVKVTPPAVGTEPKEQPELAFGDKGTWIHKFLSGTAGDTAQEYGKIMGMRRGYWPEPLPVGWLPSAAAHGALGAGLGYLASPALSWALPGLRADRLRNVAILLGGLGAATPALIGAWGAYQDKGKKGLYSTKGESYPFNKTEPAVKPGVSKEVKAHLLNMSSKSAGFGYPSSSMPPIAINSSRAIIRSDPNMSPYEKAIALSTLSRANNGDNTGLMTNPGQKIMSALMGAGVGYVTASVGGKIMGTVFGMAPSSQKILRGAGVVAGLLRGTGVI